MIPAGLLLTALWAAAGDKPPLFVVQTDTVRLDVVVSRKGAPIEGLAAADFEVFDEGVRRPVQMASRVDDSVHAVLVLDTSASVEGQPLARLKDAATFFISSLEHRDRVTVLTFSTRVRCVVAAGEPSAALAAIESAEVDGGTALFDAVFAGLAMAPAAPGVPFVLVFTDGSDQLSWLGRRDVLAAARAASATVYAVTLERLPPPPQVGAALAAWDQGEIRSADFLRQVTADTGGRLWTADRHLREVFLQVLDEVKNRYVLRFDRGARDRAGWHELKVRLKGRKGEVRTRKGYLVREAEGGSP